MGARAANRPHEAHDFFQVCGLRLRVQVLVCSCVRNQPSREATFLANPGSGLNVWVVGGARATMCARAPDRPHEAHDLLHHSTLG